MFAGATDAATQDLRSRSTRSLWDPTYVDESFIRLQAEPMVRLIPRMKDWVNTFYPGTAIGVTEYNWSAASHIKGGTTQADLLGIFGREGLDLATLFIDGSLPLDTFTAKAFQIYRNYNGRKSTFGNVSVRTTASDGTPEPTANHVGVYAAMRGADGVLTLMVVSKYRSRHTPVQVNLAGFQPGAMAEVWRLSAANGGAITRLAAVPVGASGFRPTVPAQSVTLFVLRPQNATPDFLLSCVPGTVAVALAGTLTTACSVLPMLGYTGTASLGCANPPPGVTCSFSLNPVPAGGTTTLTIRAAAGAAPNAYTIAITGIGDRLIRQTTPGVTVSTTAPPPPPSLALQVNQGAFRTGQTLNLTATLTPGTSPVTLDAYVVVRLPGGSMLSLTLGRGIVPGIVPIARGLPATSFSGELMRYRFAGT